jgi:hypothetical protein
MGRPASRKRYEELVVAEFRTQPHFAAGALSWASRPLLWTGPAAGIWCAAVTLIGAMATPGWPVSLSAD